MIKKTVLIREVLPDIIKEIINNSKEYDRLNSPIERVKSKELGRIAARERCLRKARNL